VNTSDGLRDRNWVERAEDRFRERAAPHALGALRPVDAVQELANSNDANGQLLGSECPMEFTARALELDEDPGVDYERQGSSGGPTSARIRRRSSANSSSTGGSERISSRKRSGATRRALAGPMTA